MFDGSYRDIRQSRSTSRPCRVLSAVSAKAERLCKLLIVSCAVWCKLHTK